MFGVSMKTYTRAVDTKKEREEQLIDRVPVSYTHLTLPTIYSV